MLRVAIHMRPLIEQKRLLIWYGVFFLVFCLGTVFALDVLAPINADKIRRSQYFYVFTLASIIPMIFVMLSAVVHSITHRRWGWLFTIVLTAILGAYLYAYAVANNFWEDETE